VLFALAKLLNQGLVSCRATVAVATGDVLSGAGSSEIVDRVDTSMDIVGVNDGQVEPAVVGLGVCLRRKHSSSSHQGKRDQTGDHVYEEALGARSGREERRDLGERERGRKKGKGEREK